MGYAHEYYCVILDRIMMAEWMDGFTFLNREQKSEAGWSIAGLCVEYLIAQDYCCLLCPMIWTVMPLVVSW
jgi:hypothetical protein